MDATKAGVAGIGRTEVSIIAIEKRVPTAGPVGAVVTGCARIAVITGSLQRFVEAALVGITCIGCARVPVVAGDCRSGNATRLFAVVSQRARVAIIAGVAIVGEGAAGEFITEVISAGITVVTLDFGPETATFVADIPGRTLIAVVALSSREWLVLATLEGIARVIRAVVAIVARTLVGLAVAVVVQAVANIFCGCFRVAIGETILGADSQSITVTKTVLDGAGSR